MMNHHLRDALRQEEILLDRLGKVQAEAGRLIDLHPDCPPEINREVDHLTLQQDSINAQLRSVRARIHRIRRDNDMGRTLG